MIDTQSLCNRLIEDCNRLSNTAVEVKCDFQIRNLSCKRFTFQALRMGFSRCIDLAAAQRRGYEGVSTSCCHGSSRWHVSSSLCALGADARGPTLTHGGLSRSAHPGG